MLYLKALMSVKMLILKELLQVESFSFLFWSVFSDQQISNSVTDQVAVAPAIATIAKLHDILSAT